MIRSLINIRHINLNTKFSRSNRQVFLKFLRNSEIKNCSSVEMFKNKINKWEPNDCDCNFVKIICIELDMLTWLITNPFLILSSQIPGILSHINWRDLSVSKCGRVPEYSSEGFYKFYLFYFYLIHLFLGCYMLYILTLKILFRAYNFIIKSITGSLIIFKKLRKMTNDFFNHYIFVHTFQWTSSECLTNVAITVKVAMVTYIHCENG